MEPIFLSEIQNKPVWDIRGRRVGRCVDVLVRGTESTLPRVSALAVRNGTTQTIYVPAEQISWLRPSILLKVEQGKITPYTPQGDEVQLVHQVLDRQVVDADGKRIVRVNDLQLARVGDQLCLIAADVGLTGLLRRLGLEGPVRALLQLFGWRTPEMIIPWEDVAPLQTSAAIQLRVSRDRIGRLHPADIAAIVSELNQRTGQALIEALDDATLADTLEESPADVQVAVLENLAPERAADILEEMGPDEAADVLADLPTETAQQLLDLMEDVEAAEVRRLLAYPEDSAGGIMTTEFATVPEGLTAGEALEYLRHSESAHEDEALYYVYIVDKDGRLKGAISLRDLVLAPPERPLSEIAKTDLVTVGLFTPQHEVAHLVAKYNLLAVPVVDDTGVIHGIVTVDDAIDAFIPTAYKKRLPRFF